MANRSQRSLVRLLCTCAAWLAAGIGPAVAYDWLQFGGDAQHSGNNTRESLISRNNVGRLAQKYQVPLPGTVDGAPVFLEGVVTASGARDLLFMTTKDGQILAVDAQTGASVWSHQNGPGTCKINQGSSVCYTTSSPAIGPGRLFVYSYGLDGNVHKYQVSDGNEIMDGIWPQVATLKGFDEKSSSALSIATSGSTNYLYVVNGGYPGDNGDYQGHVTAINLASGAFKVFNAACSDVAAHLQHAGGGISPTCATKQNAIWSRPGVVYDPGTDRILMATGNAFTAGQGRWDGNHNWSESVLALSPDGSGGTGANAGKPLDAYTPTNWSSLDDADADVGSAEPAILPVPAGSNVQHLAVQSGKDAKLRLINLADLSGQGGPGHVGGEIGSVIDVPQGGGVFSQPAVWVNPADHTTWAFVANGNGVSAFSLSVDASGNPSLSSRWNDNHGGTSPIVVNGMILYLAAATVRALDAVSGNLLWSIARPSGIHWESLIVANGRVYATDTGNHLTAFGMVVGSGIPLGRTDFNADAKSDILFENAAGAGWMFLMNGASILSGLPTPAVAPGWVLAGIGDFNGDGHADLLWRNTANSTQYWIYLMNGNAVIGGGPVSVAAGYLPTQIGDFNGDGNADIVWENTSGGRWIYFMNGASLLSGLAVPPAAPGWVITGVGDFNGDGKTDILWNNSASPQQYWIYLMNGGSVIGGGALMVGPGYIPTQIADFDGDTKADILWENGTTSRWIYFMSGASITSGQPAPGAASGWTVVGTGDFNADGRADLLWQNSAAPTQHWIYLLNGTSVIGGGGLTVAPGYSPLVH